MCIGDLTVFITTFFMAGTRVFANDKVEGKDARNTHKTKQAEKKAKQADRDAKRKGADKTTAPQDVDNAEAKAGTNTNQVGVELADAGGYGDGGGFGDGGGDGGGFGGGDGGGGGGDGGGQ